MGANAKSFRSVAGNNFARKLWFARLRASGLYDRSCKKGVGVCKQKTKPSAGSLKQTKYANMSPKPRSGKGSPNTRSEKAIDELIKEGAKKGKSTAQQRVALVKTLRAQGKQRGAATALNQDVARVKQASGKSNLTRYTAATSVDEKRVKKATEAGLAEKERIAKAKKLPALTKDEAKETAGKLLDKRGRRKKNKDLAKMARMYRRDEKRDTVPTPKKKK